MRNCEVFKDSHKKNSLVFVTQRKILWKLVRQQECCKNTYIFYKILRKCHVFHQPVLGPSYNLINLSALLLLSLWSTLTSRCFTSAWLLLRNKENPPDLSSDMPVRHTSLGAVQHGQGIVTPVLYSIRPCTCCVALSSCTLPFLVSVGAAIQVLATDFTTSCMDILI